VSDQEPLPDFYAILQVHPGAEPEIIEAAYRSLMRKYHPDALPPELKSDPELISRVRWINVAYDVLSDPVHRAAYDETIATQSSDQAQKIDPEIETRICHIRCAKTRQEYRMLLGRHPGVSDSFQVLGFEPVASTTPRLALPQKSTPSEPAPVLPMTWIERLIAWLNPWEEKTIESPVPSPSFPSPAEIKDLLHEDSSLNFYQINFGHHRCPACDGEYTRQDGNSFAWVRYSVSERIYCAGDLKINTINTQSPVLSRCPWCKRVRRLRVSPPEEMKTLLIKGAYGRSSPARSNQKRLPGESKRSLPGK